MKKKFMLRVSGATLLATPVVAASCVNETNIKAQEDKKEKEASKKEIMKEENKTKNKSLSSSTTESTKIAEASKTEAPKPKLAVRDSSNDSIFETWYTGSITKEKATLKLKKSKTEETPEAKIFDRLYPSLRIKDEPKLKVIDPWTIDEII